jgi:hypothetical protein
MRFWICKVFWSPEFVRRYPDRLFLFGDNEIGRGTLGQACIRYEPNAVGIPTQILPRRDDSAHWNDTRYEKNCKIIDSAIDEILRRLEERNPQSGEHLYRGLVVPENQVGSGLAGLPWRAPRTYSYLSAAMLGLRKSVFQMKN